MTGTPPAGRRVCRDAALPGQKCSWPYSDCAHREAIARAAVEARDRELRAVVVALPGLDLDMEPGRLEVPEYVSRAVVLAFLALGDG